MAILTVQSVRILTPPTAAIAPACSSEAVASAAFALVFAPPSLDVSPPTKLPLAHGGSVRSRKPPRLQPLYCAGGSLAHCRPKRALPPAAHVRAGCPRSFFAAEEPRTHSARLPSPSLAIWAVAVRWLRRFSGRMIYDSSLSMRPSGRARAVVTSARVVAVGAAAALPPHGSGVVAMLGQSSLLLRNILFFAVSTLSNS